jgi:hypothetical protein
MFQKNKNKTVLVANSVPSKSQSKAKLSGLQKILLNAPPLRDEDLFIIEQKRESLQTWKPYSLIHTY